MNEKYTSGNLVRCVFNVEDMKFLILNTTDPYINLATEEYFFNVTNEEVFMLWQNEPTVVIGKNQNAFAEINTDIINKNGIHVARRITGGGAVYHDLGNVNFTFISSRGNGQVLDFPFFTAPIIEALAELGVHAELSGRNDILVNGKKVSGNAEHSSNGRVLHHGTLLFDTDISMLSSTLKVDREKIETKAVKSVSARVTNLKPLLNKELSVGEFINTVSEFVIKKYSPEILAAPSIQELASYYDRLRSEEWIFPQREILTDYKIKCRRRFDFGGVEIEMNISEDVIANVKISGDFFGSSNIRELEEKLCGLSLTTIDFALESINIGDYIHGMTNQSFISLIKEKAE